MANSFTIDSLNASNPLGAIQDGDKIVAERTAGVLGVVSYSSTANGAVNTGLINQLGYYAAAGNTLSGLTIVNSAALLSSALGVPTWTAYTGTGSPVLNNGPTLVSPVLGTPASGNLTNCVSLPVSTGISGLGANVATALAANLNGSGAISATTSPSFITPVLGTPTSGTLTNCNGLPIAGLTGLGTGIATALAANLNGSGAITATTSPSFVTPILGTPTSGNISNCTGGPTLTSPTFITPILGTPTSGTLTNCIGYTLANLSGLGTGVATLLAAASSGTGAPLGGTSPTITTPVINGVTNASSAAAGALGEVISSSVTTVAISNSTATNVTTISLTAGDWELFGSVLTNPAGTTTQSSGACAINTVSATFPSVYAELGSIAAGTAFGIVAPSIRINVSGATTVYLVAIINYTVSTLTINGNLLARRVH